MKNNKGFAPIAIVLIVIAILAVGGVANYAGTKNNSVSKNTEVNNYQPQTDQNSVTNTPVVNSNTTNVSFSILSPKEGDQWVIGQTYSISLSQGLSSDYHPMLHTLGVINNKGGVGMICPDLITKKGGSTFSWVAGKLWSACTGTSNVSVNMPQGQYQILFGEINLDGTLKRTTKSGWFSLIASNAVLPFEKQIGYVKNIYQKNGKYYLDVDYIQWISDEKTCEDKYGKDSFNNGYCIINTNPLIRTLEIDQSASIKVTTSINANGQFDDTVGYSGNLTTLPLFTKAFNDSSNLYEGKPYLHTLFNLKINSLGKIVEMNEQFRP